MVLALVMATVGVPFSLSMISDAPKVEFSSRASEYPQGSPVVVVLRVYQLSGYQLPTTTIWIENHPETEVSVGPSAGSGLTVALPNSHLLPVGTYTVKAKAVYPSYPNDPKPAQEATAEAIITVAPAPSLVSSAYETQAEKDWQRSYSAHSFSMLIHNNASFDERFYIVIKGQPGQENRVPAGFCTKIKWVSPSKDFTINSGDPFQVISAVTGQTVLSGEVSGLPEPDPFSTNGGSDADTSVSKTPIAPILGAVGGAMWLLSFVVGDRNPRMRRSAARRKR